ncbi:MAG: FKBP12-associated protein [Heterodermia speciosa]|uniref:FKBP12-associated protein n=1 Tax=Heterodermia speciosa TaxID=116794 RepID=A0A8H3FRU4_9LECA|nr:MAG: FKBP12-associated protein [Heterodermia speciosa]
MLITCECQHLKQEIKCNASKSSEGNSKKTLSCDDECARLARNQRLALALNIDPEAHKDDHIPYSNDTLKMFRENIKWAQTQEREFRVFAADDTEKRLRFKPMPAHQRAFLHSLSEDFGFDSESVDPEPHRHVAVFKTPRFVTAPMKTLLECVRIRAAVAEAALPQSTTTDADQRKLQSNNAPLNGFLLSRPRFGLTIEDLRSDLAPTLDTARPLIFDISFLPTEEIVLKTRPSPTPTLTATSLRALKPALSSLVASKRLAQATHLCALDPSLNILRRETDTGPDSAGWSQVAAKAAAPRTAPRQMAVGERSVFTVLGSKLKDAKRRKQEEEEERRKKVVVDDWEEEVRKEEEEEEETVGEQKKAKGQTEEREL